MDQRGKLAIWLSVLTFAALRIPMAPPYMPVAPALTLFLIAPELCRPWHGVAWCGMQLVNFLLVPGPIFAGEPVYVPCINSRTRR